MSNNNNYATIKDESKEFKLNFIKNVLNQTTIPLLKKQTTVRNIFFRIKDGKEIKREWLFFENGHFFVHIAYALLQKIYS